MYNDLSAIFFKKLESKDSKNTKYFICNNVAANASLVTDRLLLQVEASELQPPFNPA
jgi:hypothetical protein